MPIPDADRLLTDDDPAPFRLHHAAGRAAALLTCDHASAATPRRLNRLGLDESAFGLHVAYDLGVAEMTETLATLLDAPLILSGFSRLVIDCNRRPDAADSIPPVSDGIAVPANQTMRPAERAQRIDEIFSPYHQALDAALTAAERRGPQPALICLHSFTPRMAGFDRPWHVGVLWNRDDRVAAPLLAGLRAMSDLVVGDNEPYTGRDEHGFTLPFHAESRDLPHVTIEVRQDLLSTPAERQLWAERLAKVLGPILAR